MAEFSKVKISKAKKECLVCNQYADECDEIVQTKRGDLFFFHKKCYDKEQEEIRKNIATELNKNPD